MRRARPPDWATRRGARRAAGRSARNAAAPAPPCRYSRPAGGGRGRWPELPSPVPAADGPREFLEITGLPEVLVDSGEAYVGDRVERLQAVHHHLADSGRTD